MSKVNILNDKFVFHKILGVNVDAVKMPEIVKDIKASQKQGFI